MNECSCAEMAEALRRQAARIAALKAENAALRADARLGAMVRRMPCDVWERAKEAGG